MNHAGLVIGLLMVAIVAAGRAALAQERPSPPPEKQEPDLFPSQQVDSRNAPAEVDSTGHGAGLGDPRKSLRPPPKEKKAKARALATMLIYTFVIMISFVIFVWALARFTRSFRGYLLRAKRTVTPTDDVWTMHRLPDGEPARGDHAPEDDAP